MDWQAELSYERVRNLALHMEEYATKYHLDRQQVRVVLISNTSATLRDWGWDERERRGEHTKESPQLKWVSLVTTYYRAAGKALYA